jgi:hypothetical protein
VNQNEKAVLNFYRLSGLIWVLKFGFELHGIIQIFPHPIVGKLIYEETKNFIANIFSVVRSLILDSV